MDLDAGDYLVGMEIVEEEGLILSISENGFGKRTKLTDYRLQSRGGKGVINMKTSTRNGKVVGILSVKEDTDLMIVTKNGKIIRSGIGRDPAGGPLHAGRAAGADGGRRPGGGGVGDSGSRGERRRGRTAMRV
jgi:hypothetical protein